MSKTQETVAALDAAAMIRTEMGWKCPYSHKVFTNDQLTGYGNPPRSPGCPVGTGHGAPMTPAAVGVLADGSRVELDMPPVAAIQ